MKRILLILLFPALCLAQVKTVRIDTSSTNIPTAYSTASTSFVVQTGINVVESISIENRTGSEIAVNCNGLLTPPSDTDQKNIYVNTLVGIVLDNERIGNKCYVRSMSGSAISSGIVVISLNGR